MKHENRLILQRWKLKIDLTKLTKSAARWVRQPSGVEKGVMMGKPPSKERQKSSCIGPLHHFRSTSLRSPTLHKPLRKTFCEMLCTLVLKDLITPLVPDKLASENRSPREREFQQQLLPKEEVEESSGKSCL